MTAIGVVTDLRSGGCRSTWKFSTGERRSGGAYLVSPTHSTAGGKVQSSARSEPHLSQEWARGRLPRAACTAPSAPSHSALSPAGAGQQGVQGSPRGTLSTSGPGITRTGMADPVTPRTSTTSSVRAREGLFLPPHRASMCLARLHNRSNRVAYNSDARLDGRAMLPGSSVHPADSVTAPCAECSGSLLHQAISRVGEAFVIDMETDGSHEHCARHLRFDMCDSR